jgi:hypothetical protein
MGLQRGILLLVLAAILAGGLGLRARRLAEMPPTGDEGESALNALTILQTGAPRGHYLGIPIYENCLTEPWPDSPEYEFRDSSYSRGDDLAIYHGWLPLYAMAASQKFFHVTPDPAPTPGADLKVRHSDDEVRTRVFAARFPSVLFGGVVLIFLFLAGHEMFGVDAGVAAMLVGAVGRPFVYMAREARYHSATLALSTGCCWAVWRVHKHGRWGDHLLAAVLLALLFHTHVLAFQIACAMLAAVTPNLLRRDGARAARKLAVTGAVTAALVVPWVLLSGMLTQASHIPPAREFLNFPADLVFYPILRIPYLILPALGVAWLAFVLLFHRRLPDAITRPLRRHRWEIAFLLAWVILGILAFTLLIPAASYFYKRLTLAVLGPGVVWGAILFAALARAWKPRYATALAPVLFLVAVTCGNMAHLWFLERPDRAEAYDMVDRLRQLHITADTKLYCTPNHQLALQYLTGLPIQSVAPVRKRFLDSYPGPILLIDTAVPYEPVVWEDIYRLANAWGYPISKAQAKRLEGPLSSYALRKEIPARTGGAVVAPSSSDDVPPFADRIADYQRRQTARSLQTFKARGANNPMLRCYTLRDWADWWPLFFYRFVAPERRMHERLNYADRLRTATADVRDTSWVLFTCPPLAKVSRLTQRGPAASHHSTNSRAAPAPAR